MDHISLPLSSPSPVPTPPPPPTFHRDVDDDDCGGTSETSERDGRFSSPQRSDSNSSSADTAASDVVAFYGVFIPYDAAAQESDDGPADTRTDHRESVYTDKQAVLNVVKKYRGARFKAFQSRAEAAHFARFPTSAADVSVADNTQNNILERGTTYRGPKAQELVKLRKAIENGDTECFMQTVWSNPRYLISSGDTPAILQEGPRYNAMHVVAKAKQPAMCRFLLDTIENEAFMRQLYNDDCPMMRFKRVDFLVDLYINTPDKALLETPLHFAAKFGCLEIVQMLASHPVCDRTRRNKWGQTARDVICSRCSASSSNELKRQIEEALEDQYFVPVLGAADNSIQPCIGEPWSPRQAKATDVRCDHALNDARFVRAYAGPMSPKKVDELVSRWKMPSPSASAKSDSSRTELARLMSIRLKDGDKGLERIAREITRDLKIPWTEHWSFLDTYCDLSKPDGLNKLETYLRNEYNDRAISTVAQSLNASIIDSSIIDEASPCISTNCHASAMTPPSSSSSSSASSTDGSLCARMSKMTLNSPQGPLPTATWQPAIDDKDDPPCPPKLTGGGSSQMEVVLENVCNDLAVKVVAGLVDSCSAWQQRPCGRRLIGRELIDSVRPSVECVMALSRCDVPPRPKGLKAHAVVARHVVQHLKEELHDRDIMTNIRNLMSSDNGGPVESLYSDDDSSEDDSHRFRPRCVAAANVASSSIVRQHLRCILHQVMSLTNGGSSQSNGSCKCDFAAGDVAGGVVKPCSDMPMVDDSDDASLSDDSTSTDAYRTPPNSIVSSHSGSTSAAKTPDEGMLVFINGTEPTKLDVDVLRAIETSEIDPVLYPHIYRWKHFVTSYSTAETEKWPTPRTPRGDRNERSFSTPNDKSMTSDSMTPFAVRRRQISAASTPLVFGSDVRSMPPNPCRIDFQYLSMENFHEY